MKAVLIPSSPTMFSTYKFASFSSIATQPLQSALLKVWLLPKSPSIFERKKTHISLSDLAKLFIIYCLLLSSMSCISQCIRSQGWGPFKNNLVNAATLHQLLYQASIVYFNSAGANVIKLLYLFLSHTHDLLVPLLSIRWWFVLKLLHFERWYRKIHTTQFIWLASRNTVRLS